MKYQVHWIVLILVSCLFTRTHSQETDTLKVLTYNVRHCSPPSHPDQINVEAIARIILDSKAEIVGLQELDVYNERSGIDLHQASRLGELTGMYFYFSKSIDYKGGAYGTAILSKYPLQDTITIALPQAAGTEQRTLSLATALLPNGQKLRIGNTHLDYTSDENAEAQAMAILHSLEEDKLPLFLTGDFNVESDSKTFALLRSRFNVSCEDDCPGTIPADSPSKTIDYIFFSPNSGYKLASHQVLNEAKASDHRPVLAQFNYEK
jgi:endonuclease/exonuclease/phosphatase family metal-dependent hydrolase